MFRQPADVARHHSTSLFKARRPCHPPGRWEAPGSFLKTKIDMRIYWNGTDLIALGAAAIWLLFVLVVAMVLKYKEKHPDSRLGKWLER